MGKNAIRTNENFIIYMYIYKQCIEKKAKTIIQKSW